MRRLSATGACTIPPGGWLPVDDVIQKGMLLDKETWEVPCEHKKPTALKRVYPKFHEELHTMTLAQFQQLTGFERLPVEWTRVASLDLGSVFAYGLAAIDPMDRWWWIGEFYDEGQFSTKQRGDTRRNRRVYDDGLLVIADPAQKQERQDLLIEANIVTVPAIKDVMLGISQVRKQRVHALRQPVPREPLQADADLLALLLSLHAVGAPQGHVGHSHPRACDRDGLWATAPAGVARAPGTEVGRRHRVRQRRSTSMRRTPPCP